MPFVLHLPSILLSTALWRSGFCRASRFLSSLAHTMKAFIGLRILCSPPTAFPSAAPPGTTSACVGSGLCPPELDIREIRGSVLLKFNVPRPSGELQSPERFWSKPISESEAGLGVPDVQGPPWDTRLGCRRVSLDKLGSAKFIPGLGFKILQTSVSVCWVAKFWKKCAPQSVSGDKENNRERNLTDLDHKSQSKASRCEEGGDEEERENKQVVVKNIPLKTIHSDSASFFSSLCSCLGCVVQRFVRDWFPAEAQALSAPHCLPVCPVWKFWNLWPDLTDPRCV